MKGIAEKDVTFYVFFLYVHVAADFFHSKMANAHKFICACISNVVLSVCNGDIKETLYALCTNDPRERRVVKWV